MRLSNLFKILIAFILIMLAAATYINWGAPSTSAEKAEAFYYKGVNENTIAARASAFNSALTEFSLIESSSSTDFSTGKLYYNIGNTYFQLEDYPLAILYYSKAQVLMPNSKELENNLSLARSKLSLPPHKNSSWLNVLLLDPWIPLPRRIQLFTLLVTLTALLYSLFIWKGGKSVKSAAICLSLLTALTLINLAAARYLSPIEAVVTKPAFLRQNSGASYPKVENIPLIAGSTVEVIELSDDKKWVKIILEEGTIGFVPTDTIRLIR